MEAIEVIPVQIAAGTKLHHDDPAKRLPFRENFMAMIEEVEGLLEQIMSDEVKFHLFGK